MNSSSVARPDEPTVLEMLETVVLLITGTVVGAATLPGFTLCIPALIAVTFAVVVPVIAIAVLATIVGAVVAIPYLLVRSIGRIRSHRAARALSASVPATGSRAASESMVLQS